MKTIIIILIILINISLFSAPKIDFNKLENKLVAEFDKFAKAEKRLAYEKIRYELKPKLEKVLSKDKSLEHSFDKLSKYITILKSDDKKLKIFSWYEGNGGTAHDMAVLVQFKSKNKVYTQWIDYDLGPFNVWMNINPKKKNDGVISSHQKKLYTIKIKNKTHYMAFGWGTFGAGFHHSSILIFSIEGDKLSFCSDCIDEKYSVIKAPRAFKIGLKYDEKKGIISFNEFKFLKKSSISTPTGKVINLTLKKDKFIKIN